MEKIRLSVPVKLDSPEFQLAAAGTGSLAIYIAAFTLPANLLRLYKVTGLDGHFLQDAGLPAYLRMIAAFVSLALLYFVGLRAARRTSSRTAWSIVICGIFVFNSVLLFMAPFDALDIYDNIFHGRIVGIYGQNPYRIMIYQYPKDPFISYPRWKDSPSAYGPLWEALAGLSARLAGDGILANILVFKLVPGIFEIAGLGAVFWYLRHTAPEGTLAGMLLLGWNPIVLYETWGNGHNDMAMIFWVLLAAGWLSRKRYSLAVLSLVVGTLFKFIPVLLIPTALLAAYRALDTVALRIRFILKTSLASAFVIGAAYWPFWDGFASFSVTRRMQMFTTSVPSVAFRLLMPGLGFLESARVVSLGAVGLLGAFVLFQLFRKQAAGASPDFPQAAFRILAFYLMATCLWFQQWYGIWLIGLAPLLSERSRRFALLFGFWVLSKQFVFGPLIVPTMADHPQTAIWLEPLLTFSILGVPWAYSILNFRIPGRMKAAGHVA